MCRVHAVFCLLGHLEPIQTEVGVALHETAERTITLRLYSRIHELDKYGRYAENRFAIARQNLSDLLLGSDVRT